MIFFGKIAGGIGGYFLMGFPGVLFGILAGHMLDELIDNRREVRRAKHFFLNPYDASFPGRHLPLVSAAGTIGAFIEGPLKSLGLHEEIRTSFLTGMLDLRYRELQVFRQFLHQYFVQQEKTKNFVPFARVLRFQGSYQMRYSICGMLFTLAGIGSEELSSETLDALEGLAAELELQRKHFQKLRLTSMPEIRREYEILGITPDTDIRGIKKAYRSLVHQFHPDAHIGISDAEKKQLEEEFRRIQDAYSKLVRSEKRFTIEPER